MPSAFGTIKDTLAYLLKLMTW